MVDYRDRLAEAMGLVSVKQLADELGLSYQAVKKVLDGKTASFTAENNAKAANFLNVSSDWLATGEGRKHIKEDADQPEGIPLTGNAEYPAIRKVRFKLSAGASGFAVEYQQGEGPPMVFNRAWYASRNLQPEKLFAVAVSNGSMETGLHDGDIVVVNTGSTEPKDGSVFAVNYEGELVIKRLVRDAGQWWLSSDNPDQRRYPRKVCDDNVFLIGEIVHKQSERI